jgi:predicted KAP-like P-loop ATPase
MELIAGNSELNTFNVLSKESYEQQVMQKKESMIPKKEWFIKFGYNNQAKNHMKTIPKDQCNKKKQCHFVVKTPPTL